jgi:hypothetical protein
MGVRVITKAELIKQITDGLKDADTISVDFHCGVLRDETDPSGWVKGTPTGLTLLIHVNGGAVDLRTTHEGTTVERSPFDFSEPDDR